LSNVNILTLKEYWANVSNAVANVGSAIKGQAIQVAGSDGTNARIIKTNANGELLTQLSGSNVLIPKTKIINFINAESFAAYPETGSGKYFAFPELDDCGELYLLLQVTKQPWYVLGSSPIVNCFGKNFTYPIYSASNLCTKTYIGTYDRGMLFVLGGQILPDGASIPTNLDEAKKLALPPKALSGKNMVFYNRASEENTVTIQLLEVWR